MADNENDNNVISLFEAKKPTLTEIIEAGTVGMTGTTGPTGGWITANINDATKKITEDASLLTDPIGDLFSGFDIEIFDKINDITARALQGVDKLCEALQPYSGDLETFFNNVQKFRQHCNGQITFPSIQEAPSKEQDALGKVRYLINSNDIEALIKTVESHHKRLLCRKVFYLLRVKLNIVNNDTFKPQATFIDMDEYMVSCGKNSKDKNYRRIKNREKNLIKEAVNILDSNADIEPSPKGLTIILSRSFWARFFGDKTKAQTYVPWLLKIDTEIEFIVAEKLIGQYTNLNNSQKTHHNYNCLKYETLFRHKYGDPKRATPDQRYYGHKAIIEAIQGLKDSGYIECTWYKGKNSLKSARPDNHEEAMGCKLKFTIPAIDEEKLVSKRPLPHQLS